MDEIQSMEDINNVKLPVSVTLNEIPRGPYTRKICIYGSCKNHRSKEGYCKRHYRLYVNGLPMDTPPYSRIRHE